MIQLFPGFSPPPFRVPGPDQPHTDDPPTAVGPRDPRYPERAAHRGHLGVRRHPEGDQEVLAQGGGKGDGHAEIEEAWVGKKHHIFL